MTKACDLSGKKVQFGNNVSKANNKTRRKFNVNLQSVTFKSELLNKKISYRWLHRQFEQSRNLVV